MTVTGRLELVALDATDIAGLASFYAELTGWQSVRNVGDWITLRAGDGQEVCALLKVKKSWLYDAVENGALEAIRLGKQLRFRPSALIRYLDERASNGNGCG